MKKYVHTDVVKLTFDLSELEDYKDPEKDNLPIYSYVSFYKAIGLLKYLEEYKEQSGKQIAALDNLACNFNTLINLKNFIKNQWKIYSIDIDADNHVFWKDDQYGHEKHYAKNLSSKVESSLVWNFSQYCPTEDDDLEDNEIVFRTFEQIEVDDGDDTGEGVIIK